MAPQERTGWNPGKLEKRRKCRKQVDFTIFSRSCVFNRQRYDVGDVACPLGQHHEAIEA